MKNGKPTDYIQNIICSITASNKFKHLILLSLAYLISLTLSAQDLALETKSIQRVDQLPDFDEPFIRHLFLKVQINPPHNQNISDYAGLQVNVLSINGELIAEGVLDQNGQTRFDEFTKVSLDQVQIYSAMTGDKITIDNPNGAVVGFLVSPLGKIKDI